MQYCSNVLHVKHLKHDTCVYEERATEVEQDLQKYSSDASKRVLNIEERIKKYTEFINKIGELQKEIKQTSKFIKEIVDKQTDDLLEKLKSHEATMLNDIQTAKKDLRRSRLVSDNFRQLYRKFDYGSDSSINFSSVAGELKTRVEELKTLPSQEYVELPKIKFTPSVLKTSKKQENIVGQLTGKNESFQISDQNARHILITRKVKL